jgi:hypothetical protein
MAYEFNGTNQTLTTASSPTVANNVPFTLACWFNTPNVTANQFLFCLNPSNGEYWGISVAGAVAGDPVRLSHSGSGVAVTGARSTAGYTANTWHHACGVFPNNSSRTIYLDGGNSATNTTAASFVTNATEIMIAARRLRGSIGGYYDGVVAEVGVWNAVLTAAEVASLAKGMTCDKVRPQSLVFYAPLIRDLIDAKGGLTITNNNGATVANHTRVYA